MNDLEHLALWLPAQGLALEPGARLERLVDEFEALV